MRVTTSRTGDTVGFDGLRAVVGAGEGVVGRFPGIVCVARCTDPGPLREFLALCASVGGTDPGRALARRLATWMSGPAAPGPELRFGTVAAAGDQLAVFLVGAVEARVDGLGGLTLSGAHAAIGTDRLFPHPRTPVVLSLDGGQVRADPADVHDLRAGVVPGAGLVLHPGIFDPDDADARDGAALAGHEWFEAVDPASDPLGGRPSWSPGVPAQRMGGRNGATHAPGVAEDGKLGDPAADPDHGRGVGRGGALEPDLGPLAFDARDADPLIADPLIADPLTADPLTADPLTADPLTADPLTADPLTADPLNADPLNADPLNGSHGGRHALLAAAGALADSPPANSDAGSAEAADAEPRDAGPYPPSRDTDLSSDGHADPYPAVHDADAPSDNHVHPDPAGPRAADSGGAARPGDAEAADQSVGMGVPDLRALDPRTGDPPSGPPADQSERADPWAAEPPDRNSSAGTTAERPVDVGDVDVGDVDLGDVDPGRVRPTSAGASGSAARTPTAEGARSDVRADPRAVDAPPPEGAGSDREHRWGAEHRRAAASVDLFTAPVPAERSPAERSPAERSPAERSPAERARADRTHADPPPAASLGADSSTGRRTSPGEPAEPLSPGADSLFAPAPSSAAPSRAPLVDAPRADSPRVDSSRIDALRADATRADPPHVDPQPGAPATPVEWPTAAASRGPATGEPPVDLFAVGPRVDGLPDARPAAEPVDHAAPPHSKPDPGPGRKRTDRSESTARIRETGSGHAAGGLGPSAAEATSTMPGLLFRPGGAATDADAVFATTAPEARPVPAALDPARGGARIRGYRCENGHLNDPRSPTCRQCGATIDERAGGLVAGPRPPLGRLLFDDGAAHVVDGGYLVGRMPEVDDRVRTGELRPIVVEDRAGSVSRVHAEIRVSGWDVIVVDTGSRNGTYICAPNEDTWTALPPRRSRRLLPGARVRMGARMFVFESSSTVR